MYSTIQKKYNHWVELQQIMQNTIISMWHMCPKTIGQRVNLIRKFVPRKNSLPNRPLNIENLEASVYLDYETPQVIYVAYGHKLHKY